MLNVLRDNLKHLKWVLWVVAISMTLYLGTYFFDSDSVSGGGANADWVALVAGSTIPAQRFFEKCRMMDEYYRQLMGDKYSEIRPQLRIGQVVVQSMVDDQIKLAEARKLGLGATPQEIARRIQTDPNFKDETGNFIGRERYTQLVRRSWREGLADYERTIGEAIAIHKWNNLMTEPVEIGDAEVEEAYRARTEKVAIDYAVVPSASQKVDTTVGDQDLAAWYQSHQEGYRRGEGRRIRYLVVERQAQVPKVQITDADIQAFYQSNQADYSRPEQRRARHILFKATSPAEKGEARRQAQAVLERLQKGEDFAAVAQATSQDVGSAQQGGDLGFFGRGRMVGAFEEAAFGTPVGQFAPLTESEFGIHVIQVTDSRPAGTAPLDEVRDAIRRQLELRRAQELVQSEAERIRREISSPQDLEAVATREGLKAEERVLTREDGLADIGASPEFMDTVFRMAPGTVGSPVGVAKGLAIVTLLEVLPPSLPPLDAIKDQVKSDILNQRAREAARAAARRALAEHGSLEEAARSLQAEVRKGQEVVPRQTVLPGAGGAAPELDQALSSAEVTVGTTGAAAVPAGAVMYAVTRKERFDPAAYEAQRDQIRQQLLEQRRSVIIESILRKLRERYQVEVNEELVERASR